MVSRKLSVESGEHLGRWTVGGALVHGLVRLEPNRFPRFELYPETHATFGPTDTSFAELVGQLHSNHDVHTGEGQLTEFFPGHIYGGANWAIVGLGVNEVASRRWERARVQISGLEAITPHPVKSVEFPTTSAEPLRYTADVRFGAVSSSKSGVELVCSYEPSTTVGDPYRFAVSTFAVADLTASSPLPVEGWLTTWLDPLREVVSIANGRAERIASVTLKNQTEDERPTTGQVFGPGISQEVLQAERQLGANGLPLTPIFTLEKAPPLAELVSRWRAFAANHTAGRLYWLAANPALNGSVRFLLLVQALESMHARDHEKAEQQAEKNHKSRRKAALDELKGVKEISAQTLKFVRSFLANKPFANLAGRLRSLFDEVPDSASRVKAWTEATAELDPALHSLGKKPKDLAERLQDARNLLSHGHAALPEQPMRAAVNILDGLTRCRLLFYLGFDEGQISTAYTRAFSSDT